MGNCASRAYFSFAFQLDTRVFASSPGHHAPFAVRIEITSTRVKPFDKGLQRAHSLHPPDLRQVSFDGCFERPLVQVSIDSLGRRCYRYCSSTSPFLICWCCECLPSAWHNPHRTQLNANRISRQTKQACSWHCSRRTAATPLHYAYVSHVSESQSRSTQSIP